MLNILSQQCLPDWCVVTINELCLKRVVSAQTKSRRNHHVLAITNQARLCFVAHNHKIKKSIHSPLLTSRKLKISHTLSAQTETPWDLSIDKKWIIRLQTYSFAGSSQSSRVHVFAGVKVVDRRALSMHGVGLKRAPQYIIPRAF